jgi:hypothetical protein
MPVHHHDAIFDQLVGGGNRLLRIARIVDHGLGNLLAEHAALGVDVGDGLVGADLQLHAERGVGTGQRPGDTDFNLGLRRSGETKGRHGDRAE